MAGVSRTHQRHPTHDHAYLVSRTSPDNSCPGAIQPIKNCHLKDLTWKMAFLLAITSGRKASEMHVLCCKPPHIRFSPASVTLFTRLPQGLHQEPIRLMSSISLQCTTKKIEHYADSVSTGHSMSMCSAQAPSGRKAHFSSVLHMADRSSENPSPRSGSQAGWLSTLNMHTTSMTSPHQMGLRATRPARWLSHTLTWLVLTLRPSVRPPLGKPPAHFPSRYYQLDAITNSDAKFGRRVLTLAGSSIPSPTPVGRVPHTSETPFPLVEEQNSHQL